MPITWWRIVGARHLLLKAPRRIDAELNTRLIWASTSFHGKSAVAGKQSSILYSITDDHRCGRSRRRLEGY
jgi:hypothetical protein